MACGADHNYIDFVAVGNHGADFSNHLDDKKYLGSVANGVIRKSNLNVLFFA
jgi:nucleotide-binding universal stress UspA family protein